MRVGTFLRWRLPAWLRQYWSWRFVSGAIRIPYDATLAAAANAIRAAWLKDEASLSDGLQSFGDERNIPRAYSETDDQYRQRLIDGWEIWTEAGTVSGPANSLAPFAIDEADVTLKAHKDWTADVASTWWSRWWVIIDNPPWTQMQVGDGGAPGAGYTVGAYVTLEEITAVVRELWRWKAGHEIPVICYLRYGSVPITGLEDVGTGTLAAEDCVVWYLGRLIGAKYMPTRVGGVDPYTGLPSKVGVRIRL